MAHPDNEQLKALFKRSKEQNAALAKTLLREKEYTGKLVTKVRSRALITVWVGGILLAGFICFTLANTIGKSLLGLEESLEHHQAYGSRPDHTQKEHSATPLTPHKPNEQ